MVTLRTAFMPTFSGGVYFSNFLTPFGLSSLINPLNDDQSKRVSEECAPGCHRSKGSTLCSSRFLSPLTFVANSSLLRAAQNHRYSLLHINDREAKDFSEC